VNERLVALMESARLNPPPPTRPTETHVLVSGDDGPVRVECSVLWLDIDTGRLIALRVANLSADPMRVTVSAPTGSPPAVELDVPPHGVAGERLGFDRGRDFPVTRDAYDALLGVVVEVQPVPSTEKA
jgi:hypothetical protein